MLPPDYTEINFIGYPKYMYVGLYIKVLYISAFNSIIKMIKQL